MLVMTDLQKVALNVKFVDAMGNDAPVQGVPQWNTSDAKIVVVEPSADGMSCVASTVGPLGTVQVAVQADADLGDGVIPIAGTLDIQVIGSLAVAATIAAGTPEAR